MHVIFNRFFGYKFRTIVNLYILIHSFYPYINTKKHKKEDLRIAAGLTTNMIANMGKNKGISMETLAKICDALQCEITDVIELTEELPAEETKE